MSTTAWAGRSPVKQPPLARVVISLLSGDESARCRALNMLAKNLGPLSYLSASMPFVHSAYYEPEMGKGLTRRLAAYRELKQPGALAEIKQACMAIEETLSQGGRRTVNLDPGLLSADALILATSKPVGHRVCISPGLYAEVTLHYHGGEFKDLAWTYQDYAGKEIKSILKKLRSRYCWRLRQDKLQGEKS